MAWSKKLTDTQERALLVDYQDGWRIRDLTIIYRVSERTVYRTLADYGMPRVKKRRMIRKAERKRHTVKDLKPCGTNAAYVRHKRAGEYPCTACLAAHAEDQKKWRALADKKRKKKPNVG